MARWFRERFGFVLGGKKSDCPQPKAEQQQHQNHHQQTQSAAQSDSGDRCGGVKIHSAQQHHAKAEEHSTDDNVAPQSQAAIVSSAPPPVSASAAAASSSSSSSSSSPCVQDNNQHHHQQQQPCYYPPVGASALERLKAVCGSEEQEDGDAANGGGSGGGGGCGGGGGVAGIDGGRTAPHPEVKYLSPRQRLIKVEGTEKIVTPGAKDGGAGGGGGGGGGKAVDEQAKAGAGGGKGEKVSIVDDYADPYDAPRVGGGPRSSAPAAPPPAGGADERGPPDNDGYMEPYEAQRLMAEIRKQSLKEQRSRGGAAGPPLYDNPYEPHENGGGPFSSRAAATASATVSRSVAEQNDAGGAGCGGSGEDEVVLGGWVAPHAGGRDSRLPQDDERPPDEYEEPWEWKRGPLSKALQVQLDGGGEGRASAPRAGAAAGPGAGAGPAEERLLCHPQRAKAVAGSGPGAVRRSPEHYGPIGEKIDPSLPLDKQVWYHGAIGRVDAENLLRLCKESSYLVRNSETSKNEYSLSLKSSQGFMHMKLTRTKEGKYILGQNSPPFDAIPEVIHFYTSRKLPIKGAEHMSLLYPVPVRTL